jgi:hypothetical protein
VRSTTLGARGARVRRALSKQGLTLSKISRGPSFSFGPYCVRDDSTGLVTTWRCSLEELEHALEHGSELPAGDRRSAI